MVVARPLPPPKQEVQILTPLQTRVCELLADGVPHTTIARKLAKGDPKKAKIWRSKIRRWCRNPYFQTEFEALQRAEGLLHVGPSVQGIGRRAARGRVDAAKLLWSMTGFHNERVDHKHSGAIEINVSIPRPRPTEDNVRGPGKIEEGFVDADVVEEE